MQRKIGTEIEPYKTVSPFDSVGASSAIERTTSNYTDAGDKVGKIRKLIETGTSDADIALYILGTLGLIFQGMLEDIKTKEQPVHSLHRDMENLDFQILLTAPVDAPPKTLFPIILPHGGFEHGPLWQKFEALPKRHLCEFGNPVTSKFIDFHL